MLNVPSCMEPPFDSSPYEDWVVGISLTAASLPVLCLAQTIHTREGALPRPSISVEPGTVIPRGSPVTFHCQGPVGVHAFRLERVNRSQYKDNDKVSLVSPFLSEATFRIDSVSEDSAGRYRCIYHKASRWSEYSEQLRLEVEGTPGGANFPSYPPRSPHSNSSSPRPTPPCTELSTSVDAPAPQGLNAEHLYILIAVSVVFLFCLFLLVLFFLHRQNQIKQDPDCPQGPPEARMRSRSHSRGEAPGNESWTSIQSSATRLPLMFIVIFPLRPNLAVDVLERKADMTTVDALPEKDRETSTSAPASGRPQEVTYAQLDHRALTRRTAQAVSPQSTEPLAEASTYAAIVKR
ncbi:leukocyte-associated immunoglobulin-like receptor 1 isoform X2 [Aotus nancymaae]|uniref:leukocyte-associated immunoglobulin-like receptor 1 isoform X2 n=1 Tax=Aotus nancymaae TaxID=37293 RepID=UPI0030FECB46